MITAFLLRLLKRISRPFWGRGIYLKFPLINVIYGYIYCYLSPDGIIPFDINGLKIYVKGKLGIAKSLGITGSYEKETTALFAEILKEGMVVLDIGANIGYFSILASSLVGDSGRVFAFEPFPQSLSLLQKSIEINGIRNITLVAKAVSDQCGRQKFFLANSPEGHSLEQRGNSRFIEVDTITVDKFIEELNIPVNLVKIDVESSESKVLLGMKETISKNKDIEIIFEAWDKNYLAKCRDILQSYGLIVGERMDDFNYRARRG